jgi:hypothetical protein
LALKIATLRRLHTVMLPDDFTSTRIPGGGALAFANANDPDFSLSYAANSLALPRSRGSK